jgi:putative thioredoxin
MTEHVVEVTLENAQQVLIDTSMTKPVVIDFWADWCAPCKALMPILEKLAAEYDGAFLLAKVNADQLPEITGQFGVRSLPTVVVMKEGQPVDAFQGAQPESTIRQLLDKYLPKPWDRKLDQAQKKIQSGDYQQALPLLREAYAESKGRADIAFALTHTWLQLNRLEDAKAVLDKVAMKDQDAMYEQLMAQWALKQEAAKSPAIQALEQQLNQDPDNLEVAYELAVQFSQDGHHKEALELLLSILERDRSFRDGGARKVYLDILATLGKGDPLAVAYQRKIYNLLY